MANRAEGLVRDLEETVEQRIARVEAAQEEINSRIDQQVEKKLKEFVNSQPLGERASDSDESGEDFH